MTREERLEQIEAEISAAAKLRDRILTHPYSLRDELHARALEKLIETLRLERGRILESQ